MNVSQDSPMPVNRRTEPEAEKRAQLIAAARELFIRHGYEATPMTRIAQSAGVAPNTIYWYFKDKDELLIAVLDELFEEHLRQFLPMLVRPLQEQLLWLVARLRTVSRLMATVHNRCSESEAIQAWHSGFHRRVEQLFGAQLPPHLPRQSIASELRIAAYTIEGLVTHDVAESDSRQTCEALASRWTKM